MSKQLTHLNPQGEAHMVDVGGKAVHPKAGNCPK